MSGAFLSNAHTHTRYCDGKNTVDEMVEAAIRLGFVSLGFSEHGAQGFDAHYSMDGGRQEAYLAELRAPQARHQGREGMPRIWIGVEQDALTPKDQKKKNREELDYVLGSTHYASRGFRGKCVPVDGDVDLLRAYVEETYTGDMLAMAQAYFDDHVKMLLNDRPDIIGHFDVVCKNAHLYRMFDPDGVAYRKMALNALEAARACGGVLEVNTGGMARGALVEPYPSRELLQAWREMGGEVTLTSDCHDAAFLDYAFEREWKALKALGYGRVLRLGMGSTLWEEMEL